MKLFYWIFIIGGFTILFMVLFYSTWREEHDLKLSSSGKYVAKIDLSSAEFTKAEIEYYSNTYLTLNGDGTFLFSKSVPIGRGSMGKWRITGNKVERAIELSYKSGLIEQVSTCSNIGCLIEIGIPVYTENLLTGHKPLAFKKIASE